MIDEFRRRGLFADATEHVRDALDAGQVTGYIGFDPTAASLHVGSLVPIMGLVHLQRAGHCPIALVGGGTGLIGDPSGKVEERALLDRAQAEENAEADRQAVDTIETRNNADSLAYQTERLIKDNGEKLNAEDCAAAEQAIEDVREALKGEDLDGIRSAVAVLQTASQKLGEQLYAAQQAAGDGAAADGPRPSSDAEDVVDAEFETSDADAETQAADEK